MFRKIRKRKDIPEGLFLFCPGHGQIVYRKTIEENFNVCPQCNFHFRIGARKRIEYLVDKDSFEESLEGLKSKNPLGFRWLFISFHQALSW